MGITRATRRQTEGHGSMSSSIFFPRIWKMMIAGAYPFLLLSAGYFEALERTGTVGAFIADTLLPITWVGYAALIFVLKKRGL